MVDKSNVLWEKHRMYLPDMRKKAIHRCKDCKFFVAIKGKTGVLFISKLTAILKRGFLL